jgi:signal-transduction protein with cAMP-binding, CBS, and nucleotidyltransferase domain
MKKPGRGSKVTYTHNTMPPEIQDYFGILFNNIKAYLPHFSDALTNSIVSSCEIFAFKRNDIILDYGETCRHCYFCISGMVTAKYIKDGREKAKWFFAENDLITSVKSFFRQIASADKLIAKEPTICLAIPWEKLEHIYDTHPEFNKVGRKLTEYYYELAEDRAIWVNNTAEERYNLLFREYPKLVNRITDTELSSYLGISRQYLSKIKKQSRKNSFHPSPLR